MLVERQTPLSTKPRLIARRVFYTVLCQTLTVQMYETSIEISTAHQTPTHPMKSCFLIVAQSPALSPRLTPSSIIMPGSASSI